MKTRIPIRWGAAGFEEVEVVAERERLADSGEAGASTLLLVSEDATLFKGLCLAPAENSLSLVQAHSLSEAIEQANRSQLAASLLDLDMRSGAGWQAAEWFLGQGTSAPILMITGRADHYEVGAAIRSGVVFEKSIGSARLLDAAVAMLGETAQESEGRTARQQVWLRRAKPYRWEAGAAPGYRQWGINE